MAPVDAQSARLNNFGALVQSAWTDFAESEHRFRLCISTIAALGTIAVNVPKLPLVGVPNLALEALEHTNSPTVTGLITGAIFGAWTLGAASLVDAAGNHFPKVKQVVRERFSRATDFLSNTLPGFTFEDEDRHEHRSRAKQLGHGALTHIRRGLTVLGIGAGFYVGTAQIEERPRQEIRRLRRLAAGDATLMIGGLSCATTAIVTKITEKDPALAERIQDGATDSKILVGLAVSLLVSQGLNKRRHKRQLGQV
ncbi:MAG: hypothetical protein V4702_03175 [Patescibacteria group bacterium]